MSKKDDKKKIVIDPDDPEQLTCGMADCPFCEWVAAYSRPAVMQNPNSGYGNEFIKVDIMAAVDRGCTLGAPKGGFQLIEIMDQEEFNATPYGKARTSRCKEIRPPKKVE